MQRNRGNKWTRLQAGLGPTVSIFFVGLTLMTDAIALQPNIPIAPEPVGSGARALAQSAFIAVADDATAASWNPAGLIRLERPESSFVGLWKNTWTNPEAIGSTSTSYAEKQWDTSEINFMSFAQPLELWNRDIVVSMNYHQVYDLTLELEWAEPLGPSTKKRVQRTEGAISAYSLAFGSTIPGMPRLMIGSSFNYYAQGLLNGSVRHTEATSDTFRRDSHTTETIDDLKGYNFTFGLLWDVHEQDENLLTLGLVCQTPFTAQAEQSIGSTQSSEGPLHIDFPFSFGLGINYRFSDEFGCAFDIQRTNWSEYTYRDPSAEGEPPPPTPTRDAVAYRMGFEYLGLNETRHDPVMAIRAGAFYDARPLWDAILPVYGLSFGMGWTLPEKISYDFAYQYRWGGGDIGDATVTGDALDFKFREHWFFGSIILYH